MNRGEAQIAKNEKKRPVLQKKNTKRSQVLVHEV